MSIVPTPLTGVAADYAITDIVNVALISKLGAEPIESLNDNIKQARVMKRLYPIWRDAELSAYNWTFATKRAELAVLTDDPDTDEYEYQYQLPSDFLRLIQAGDYWPLIGECDYVSMSTAPYIREGDKLLTNYYETTLNIRYIYQLTDALQYPALFKTALICRLGLEACEALTEVRYAQNRKQTLMVEYRQAIKAALLGNAIEIPPEHPPITPWLEARL
jgi:hypothetical protein